MVNMSAKFDKEIYNGVVSIVFTRSSHGRTETWQRYYIPTAMQVLKDGSKLDWEQ